jgi:hypothetical protein
MICYDRVYLCHQHDSAPEKKPATQRRFDASIRSVRNKPGYALPLYACSFLPREKIHRPLINDNQSLFHNEWGNMHAIIRANRANPIRSGK